MRILLLTTIAALALSGCITQSDSLTNSNDGDINDLAGQVIVQDVSLQTDFDGAKVAASDLEQGCFTGQDCIQSIDHPSFEEGATVDWLADDDMVFAIDLLGVKRAYPQKILNRHEIVNDQVGDEYFAMTFCPLCGSAVAFTREVNGVITEFGVSGKLHNSDLVMYDRFEGNLWQQITGEAIVGPAARRDEVLEPFAITTTTWMEWFTEHPNTEVLSRDNGALIDYDLYPYGTYEQDDEIYFGVENLDTSLQIKTVVYGIEVGGVAKAYTEDSLLEHDSITDDINGVAIIIQRLDSGEVIAQNIDTGEEIVTLRLFWFAWASFHPETELYK